jgi:hypothetical protein
MGYTNSGLVDVVRRSPNHSGQRNHKIDYITPHCVVGQLTAEGIGSCFPAGRDASCNYGIGRDGRVVLVVDEKNRSWCTSSRFNDQRAVTIECASDAYHPYAFNTAVWNKLILLCADICKRNGIKKLLWLGSAERTWNYTPKDGEALLTAHRWYDYKACVPIDSEVLTRDGWVKLSDIEIGDEIACADLDNLRITFEEVYDKVETRSQDTYTNNGFTATKDHRCVYRTHGRGEYRINDYKHLLADGNMIFLPMAGYYQGDGFNITDSELKLLVAVQADGHYMHESRSENDPPIGLEFHLKKERKIERIKELLDECNIDYAENPKSDGSVSIRIWGRWIVDECEKYLTGKCFDWKWINLSPHQVEVFLDELLLWDGCTAANMYTSRQQINLDVVSAIAAMNGVGSNVSGSNIQFRKRPECVLSKDAKATVRNNRRNPKKTTVSCVSVKTGIFLVRQYGKTFITGNCPGDWCYSRLGTLANEVNKKLGTGSTTITPSDNVNGDIDVDGLWGVDTTYKAQKVFGTYQDGEVSDQDVDCKRFLPACLRSSWEFVYYTTDGSDLIRAIQKKCGLKGDDVDGIAGHDTVEALQKFLNKAINAKLDTDGILGEKTCKAFQRWLNRQ